MALRYLSSSVLTPHREVAFELEEAEELEAIVEQAVAAARAVVPPRQPDQPALRVD